MPDARHSSQPRLRGETERTSFMWRSCIQGVYACGFRCRAGAHPLRPGGPVLILSARMSLMEERRAQMYPSLTEAQIARIAALGTRRRVGRGEILFEQRQV